MKTCVEHGVEWANHCQACEASRFAHARDAAWSVMRGEHDMDIGSCWATMQLLSRELLMLDQTVRFLWNAWAEREGDGQPEDAVFGPGLAMLQHLAAAGEPIPKFAPVNVQAIVREATASTEAEAFTSGAPFVVPENKDPSDVIAIGASGEVRFPRIPAGAEGEWHVGTAQIDRSRAEVVIVNDAGEIKDRHPPLGGYYWIRCRGSAGWEIAFWNPDAWPAPAWNKVDCEGDVSTQNLMIEEWRGPLESPNNITSVRRRFGD